MNIIQSILASFIAVAALFGWGALLIVPTMKWIDKDDDWKAGVYLFCVIWFTFSLVALLDPNFP